MAFAQNVKRLREEKGLTQQELANLIEVAQPTVAQYEKGMKVPTIITGVLLAKLATELGAQITYNDGVFVIDPKAGECNA